MQKSSYLNSERVKIFARIKAPSQNELYTTPANQAVTKRVRSPSPTAVTTRKTTSIKAASVKDYAYSFYAHDRAGASKVFYFANPIQKRLLDESIKSEDDIEHLQSSILASSQIFTLNRAFSVSQNNQAVYNETVKPLVYELLQGQTSTVFIHGCAESGKSYLIRGEDTREKGLAIYATDELLKLIQLSKQSQSQEGESKHFRVYCSIFLVHNERRIDLIQKSSIPYESTIEHDIEDESTPLEEPISNTDDFKSLYRKAISYLKALASHSQNATLVSDSNIVVSLKLVKLVGTNTRQREIDQQSYLNFVRLADVESSQADRSIKESFQILREYLCYLGKKAEGENYTNIMQYQKDKLIESVPALLSGDTLVHFICTLPPSVQSPKASLSSLKYAAQLFSDINESSLSVKDQKSFQTYESYSSPSLSRTRFIPSRQRPTGSRRNDQSLVSEEVHDFRRPSRINQASDFAQEDLENEQERNIRALEKNIDDLKNEILSKIDVALRKDSPKSVKKDPINLSDSKEDNEEAIKANKSFEKLKEMLEKKEQLELETNEALKAKIHRLGVKNKKLIEEIHRLSELLFQRDEIIANYESERKLSQMELSASANKIVTQQIKEEAISKSKQDLNEIITKLRNKLHTKKIKNRESMERLTAEHKKSLEALSKLEQENENLRSFLERERGLGQQEEERFRNVCVELKKAKDELEKKEQIINSLNENCILQEEVILGLKTKIQEEKTQNRILADEQTIYSQKMEILKKETLKLEAENENLLKKYDSVKESVAGDTRTELLKSKEKNKKIRQQLKQSESRIRELEEELARASFERQRAKNMDEELFEARAKIKKLSNEIEILQLNKDGPIKEVLLDKQQEFNKIQNLEKEVTRLTEEIVELQSLNSTLKQENQESEEENRQKSILLEKYEKQLEYLQTQQIEEIENLQIKLKDFVEQIDLLRTENHQKHLLASTLVEKLAYAEKERDEYLEKYRSSKKQGRTLKKNIKQIDAKMKRLIEQNRTEEAGEEEGDYEIDSHNNRNNVNRESLSPTAKDQDLSDEEEDL